MNKDAEENLWKDRKALSRSTVGAAAVIWSIYMGVEGIVFNGVVWALNNGTRYLSFGPKMIIRQTPLGFTHFYIEWIVTQKKNAKL